MLIFQNTPYIQEKQDIIFYIIRCTIEFCTNVVNILCIYLNFFAIKKRSKAARKKKLARNESQMLLLIIQHPAANKTA